MFRVEKNSQKLHKLTEVSFEEIGFKERQDIQQLIISDASVLGEELLIIQEEFHEFENTNERLDLMALDKRGNLVIIENKRDDTGTDVVWQAIKYASYCSTLQTNQVIAIFQDYLKKKGREEDAEETIKTFLSDSFDDDSLIYPGDIQRIIMASHKFRPEVLSAAQWLMTPPNNVDITCVEIHPFIDGDTIYLDSNVLLPQEATKEYTLKLSEKASDIHYRKKNASDLQEKHREFWTAFATQFESKGTAFENRTSWATNSASWISAPTGIGPGIIYNLVVNKNVSRVEVRIDSGDKQKNKAVFDYLASKKPEIEALLEGISLVWDRSDTNRVSIIKTETKEYSFEDQDSWDDIMKYLKETYRQFEKVFRNIKLPKNL